MSITRRVAAAWTMVSLGSFVVPGKEPLQAGVDLDHPEWERVLNEIFADMRLGALRYLLAEARRLAQVGSPTPPEPTAE